MNAISRAIGVGASLALALGVCGCTSVAVSNASSPLVTCGTRLSDSAAGPVLIDGTRNSVIRELTSGVGIYLLVSKSCAHGASVTIEPSSAASVAKTADAADGHAAAVALRPLTDNFMILVRPASGPTTSVTVRLAGLPAPLASRR